MFFGRAVTVLSGSGPLAQPPSNRAIAQSRKKIRTGTGQILANIGRLQEWIKFHRVL